MMRNACRKVSRIKDDLNRLKFRIKKHREAANNLELDRTTLKKDLSNELMKYERKWEKK